MGARAIWLPHAAGCAARLAYVLGLHKRHSKCPKVAAGLSKGQSRSLQNLPVTTCLLAQRAFDVTHPPTMSGGHQLLQEILSWQLRFAL